MAEPGHPHDVGVLHNRHPAAGTHMPLRKEFKISNVAMSETISATKTKQQIHLSCGRGPAALGRGEVKRLITIQIPMK